MTATTSSRVPLGRYRFSQVARMEWAKVRTLRSTAWILLILAAGMIGLAILVLSQYPSDWAHMSAAQRASFDPTEEGFAGVALGQLTMGVLGVLVITSEYSSGMIRATLSAVPRRGMLLTAKAAVLGALVLPAVEILAFAALLAGQAVSSRSCKCMVRAPTISLSSAIAACCPPTMLGKFFIVVAIVFAVSLKSAPLTFAPIAAADTSAIACDAGIPTDAM